MNTRRHLVTVSMLAFGCSGPSKGSGVDTPSAGRGGSTAADAGMSSATPNSGASGSGGAGMSSGATGVGGGSAAGAGAAGTGVGGTGAAAAGAAGTGGQAASASSEPVAVTSPDALGQGPCDAMTLADVVAAIHTERPELADEQTLYKPNLIEDVGEAVFAFTSKAGFRVVLFHGFGDCPAGCINREYFYFETNDRCEPVAAGEYRLIYSSAQNCYTVVGEPLWGVPDGPAANDTCEATTLPPGFNADCTEAACPIGLTPTTFMGVTGEQCLCMIHCTAGGNECPPGSSCQSPPDVPQNSCYE